MKAYTSDIMLFDVHDAIGKHILELYPDRKPEESTILNALKGLPTPVSYTHLQIISPETTTSNTPQKP